MLTKNAGQRHGTMLRRQALGSLIALVLGVTMLTMTALLLVSAQPQVPPRFAAAPIVVTPQAPDAEPDTFPEARRWSRALAGQLAARLTGVAGVRAAILDTPTYAQPVIDGRPVPDTAGNAWRTAEFAPYPLIEGGPPTAPDHVVVSSALGRQPGARVTILTVSGPAEYTIAGLIAGPGTFFLDTNDSGVSAIALLTSGDVDLTEVRSIMDGHGIVHTGDGRSALEPAADARKRWIGMQVLTAMGALAGFVAIFLVSSTFSFGVLQRRRDLGLLRMLGATRGQIRRMMIREALGLGAIAGACGVALGGAAAPVLGRMLVNAGFEPATFEVRFEVAPMAVAFGIGLVVACAGVLAAARRASRAGPMEALRDAEVERHPMTRSRWILGGLSLGAGAAAGLAAASADALSLPTYAGMSAMALVAGLSVLSPALVPPVARVLLGPFAATRIGLLARQSTSASARRTAATAAPVLLTVAFAMLVSGMVATGAQAYAARRVSAMPAAAVLVPDGTPGLTDAVVTAAGGLALTPTTLYLGNRPLDAIAVAEDLSPGASSSPPPSESAAAARPAYLPAGDDAVVVTRDLAVQYGWAIGSELELTVSNGQTVRLRVTAIRPAAGMPAPIVLRRTAIPPELSSAVFLKSATGTDFGPGTKMVTPAGYAASADAEEDRLVWIFTLILVLMATGFTVIAVANTLLMATVARARDLLVLRRAGATPRQVLGLVATETSFVVLLGTAMGMLVAIGGLLAIRAGLSEQIGVPLPLVVPWPVPAAAIAACLLAGLAASVLPAWLGSRPSG